MSNDTQFGFQRRIERFLRRAGMPATRFGREAASYPSLVFEIRMGRMVRTTTKRRVEAYLNEQEAMLP